MNRRLYRIVFNAARGLWMAVQETANGFGKGRAASGAGKNTATAIARGPWHRAGMFGVLDMLEMRHVAFAALCVLGMQPLLVHAQVTALPSAPAASKPTVGATANGLPIVQIVTPNGAGVSNNLYSQFNVGPQGLILNNSKGNVLTQQAGYVTGNPYLASGSASIIVNQVVGGNASQLLGYIEVAGPQAQVIVANPSGIYCNGCGFVNTSRGVLTTGTPVFGGSGSLDAFHVTGGYIQIGTSGLNASNVDEVDLIARSVEINGNLWANKTLNVVAGANDVQYGNLSAQALAPDGNSPGVAIDVAQLGGMYAGKITLVGTEAGVGVNSEGTIEAQSGDLTLSSQGKVTLTGATSAAGNINVQAVGDVSNSGNAYAAQNATVASQGQVSNSGTFAAMGNTNVSGAAIASSGAFGAGIDANGNVTGTGNLAVTAPGTVSITGQNLAGGNLVATGSSLNMAGAQTFANGNVSLSATGAGADTGNIVHTGATLSAGGGLALTAAGALINDQGQMSASQLGLSAASVSNRSGTLTQTGTGVTDVSVTGSFDNTNGHVATNATNTNLQTGSLTNAGGQITDTGTGLLTLTTGAIDNSGGTLGGNGGVSIAASGVSNASGSITAGQALNVTVAGDIDNTQGSILAGGAANLSGADVWNTAGRIVSLNADGLSISATGQITNATGTTAQGTTGGVIGGNGNATIDAATLTNSGTVTASQALNVTVGNTLDNSGGTLSAETLTADAASLENVKGTISADTAALTIPQLDNSSGQIIANQLTLAATNLVNEQGSLTQVGTAPISIGVTGSIDNSNGGVIQTNSQDLMLAPATLNNNGGTITDAGTGTLTIDAGNGAGSVTNAAGKIVSNGQVAISVADLDNMGGSVSAQSDLSATLAGALTNTNGSLVSNANVSVTASGALTNANGTIAGGSDVNVQAASLTNSGSIGAGGTLTATVAGTLDNSGGTMSATTLTASAAALTNVSGSISANTVGLTIPQLDNSSGQIITDALTLAATDLTNQHGTLTQLGTGAISVNVSDAIDNSNGGVIQTNSQDFTLNPAALNNNDGTITHAGAGTLTIDPGNGLAALTNVGGSIGSNGAIAITASSFDNTSGTVSGQGAVSASATGALDNTSGLLRSSGSLTVTSGAALTNAGGTINAGGAGGTAATLDVSAASIDNTGGAINNAGTGATTVDGASQITNSNAASVSGMGLISGNGSVTITTSSLTNKQGGQLSGADLQINAGSLDNTGGLVGNVANANGDIGISTSGALTNAGGQISAAQNLTIGASTLSGGGAFSAAGNLTLNLQGDFSTAPGYSFSAGNDLTFTLPGTFSNAGSFLAVNNLSINAGNIYNSGALAAGGLLSTQSSILTNTGTVVGGSVSLTASQTLSNLGTTALIGATDSAGTLELLAPDIENRDDVTGTDTQATTAIYGLGNVVLAGGKDASGNYTSANLIDNQSALIESGGDMQLVASQVTNTRRIMTTSGFTSSVDPNLLASMGISLSGQTGQVGVQDANSIGGVYIDPPHGGEWNSTYEYTTYTGTAVANTVTSISPESQIIAGGNLYAASVGTFQNYWSQVAAAGNIAAPQVLDQNSWAGQTAPQVQVTYSGEYHYNNYDNSEYNWQLPFGNAGFVTSNPGGYQAAPADIRTYALPAYESTFTAGGTLSGTGVSIDNTAGNASVTPLGLLPGQSVSEGGMRVVTGIMGRGVSSNASTAQSAVGGRLSSGVGSAANPIIAGATAENVLNNLTVPQGGLFHKDTAPNAPYLIATNSAFTNQQQWLSSNYYFEQLGMNPQQIQMRLGDGFYEQQLVQNQIMSLTGKSVLTDYSNTQQEFQALMTSGAQLAKALDLTPGMGLSPAQVSQLTSNVVIMQTEVVDGQSVLVPVVYLAKANQQNMSNGPTIAATDIDLENTKSFTNSGTVSAANSLTITGQSINNQYGTLASGGQMTLATTGDVDLTSATVNAGSLQLQAGGNLILDTAAKTLNQVSATGATRSTTTLAPLASINVTGDAAIVTGGNFEQNAGSLNVGGALGMNIGGNWDLGVQQTGETKVVAGANGVSDTHIVSDTGSSVKVGGASSIGVGGDLTATGANINLGGGGTIAAAGNVTLQAATATSTVDSNSSGSDNHGSYTAALHTSDDAVTGTTLQSGDSLNIVSGKDINVMGSTIDLTQGNAALMAAGNVNIGATTETHVSDVSSSGSHGGFMSSTSAVDRVDQTTTLADGSTLSADGVSIVSGKDINVTGSNIVGTNDVSLAATGNVNITAATDTYQDSEYHDVKHSGFSGTGGIGISYGSSEQTDQYNATSVTQSQSSSTVGSVAGNVSISAGKDVHIGGSNVVAGKASNDTTGATGNITVQAQNITIDPGQDNEQSQDQQNAHSSGFSVGITGTPLDTARNLSQAGSSGNGFQRLEGVSDELLASSLDMPSVSVSFSHSSSSSTTDLSSLTNNGSTIRGGGNVSLIATGGAQKDANGNPIDGDITMIGSTLTAGGIASLSANRNVVLQTSTDQLQQSMQSSSSSSGFSLASPSPGDFVRWVTGGPNSGGVGPSPYNASRGNSDGNSATTQQTASAVIGNSVVVTSKTGDIDVIGSGISGTQGVDMIASQGAINVLAGIDTSQNHQASSSEQIGDLGSNGTGTGFSVGISKTNMVQDTAAQTQSTIRGQIVSANGNVSLDAKQNLTVQGSDLSAGKDLTLMGQNVSLDAGTDAMQSSMSQSSSQFGVTTTIGGALGNAVATINQSMSAAQHADNQRLAALDEAQAALSAYGIYQASTSATASSLVKVTASIGGGTSHSASNSNSVTNDGSTLTAGGNVTIVATGSGAKDANGNATDGDITASGTQITGQNVELSAARDIDLQSAQDTNKQTSSNSSSGGSIGLGFTLGGQQNGFSLELAANGSKGQMNGDGTTNRNTQVTASQTLSMTSGRDTNLIGAEVSGNTVDANVGRNLNIVSPQDTNTYDSKQTSAGVQLSLCIPPFCVGGSSGSASVSQQTIKDNYQSVGQQSGIYAGTGGFDVQVGNHTQLNGGVIASTAGADKNTLSTQTLSFTNLENTSDYSGSSVGLSASGGVGFKTPSAQGTTGVVQTQSNTPGATNSAGLGPSGFGAGGTSSSESGTTYAAVSAGTITVRGDAGTGQDSTAGLSRDTTNANAGALVNSFDAQAVGDDLAMQTQTVQVGMQVVGDVGTYLETSAAAKVKAALAEVQDAKDPEALAQAEADLQSAEMQVKLWGNDGAGRMGMHAIVAGLGAAMGGGNVLGAVGGTIAGDEASGEVSSALDNTLGGKILSNIVSGAAGAAAGALLGGGAGAVSGANGALGADLYNRQLHPDEKQKLAQLQQGQTPEEQQRLADAACYLVQCAAQLSDSNPGEADALASQQRGAGDIDEQNALSSTGLFIYDPVVDGWGDRLSSAWDWTGPGAMRGAQNLGSQLLTKIRQGLGTPAPADPLTDANNGGTGTPPTPAVVTPATTLMTPEGPVLTPGVAVPGSPGYVPPTATLSSGSGGDDNASSNNNGSNANGGSNVTSPNDAMRTNANATGTYVDPLTGETVPADGTLAADHIVPQSWIKAQPGFDQLTPAQQSALLNDPANTQGLPTTFNSSKGAKMPGDWQTYKGQPLDPGYIQSGAQQAETLKGYITDQIGSMLGK
ncbi:hemagglutinin repeat-containing protein [Trinickia acidisoli]|uniref:hemagglutinin repeat-containing protein n=1 Tax=Trinickia acidisoli TaxID=2767482 RepID=UPI001A8F7820|nr:hemagglutinin repeat-containing protein [Trinickia acidisoli]